MDDPTAMADGGSHGQAHPFRWDHSTALAVIILAALAALALIHMSFKVGISGGVGR
jgi:hypothetical protein